VEFDVRLTADGVPVVIHDADLARVAGVPARISRLTLNRLCAIPVAGAPVPTLADSLDCCTALRLGANVELKYCGMRSRALVRAAAAVLGEYEGRLPLLVSSFRPAMLAGMRRHAPAIPRGLLLGGRPRRDWRRLAARLGCISLHPAAESLNASAVATFAAAGLPLVAYTVNDPARAAALFALGVAAVITDRPDRMAGIVGRR
jgi:glycerophosphoryl diester phosphodiesterase